MPTDRSMLNSAAVAPRFGALQGVFQTTPDSAGITGSPGASATSACPDAPPLHQRRFARFRRFCEVDDPGAPIERALPGQRGTRTGDA